MFQLSEVVALRADTRGCCSLPSDERADGHTYDTGALRCRFEIVFHQFDVLTALIKWHKLRTKVVVVAAAAPQSTALTVFDRFIYQSH